MIIIYALIHLPRHLNISNVTVSTLLAVYEAHGTVYAENHTGRRDLNTVSHKSLEGAILFR